MLDQKDRSEQFNTDQSSNKQNSTKSRGPQGIDKAPGEEPSGDNENVVADTQKARNKNDGDPSNQEDQPKDE